MPEKTALDADRIAALTDYAIRTHAEAAELQTLRDLGATPAYEVEDDEMTLYLTHPERDDTLRIAAWPITDAMPSQN